MTYVTFSVVYLLLGLPQASALRVSMSANLPTANELCAELEGRQFEFIDSLCGTQLYRFDDVMAAHQIEENYWSTQGETNPWWAVLTGFDMGVNIPIEQKLAFYEMGNGDIDQMRPLLEKYNAMPNMGTALDLGCGLGRMGNALANHMGFQNVFCVDQSKSFLLEAETSLAELAGQGVVMSNASKRITFLYSDPALGCVVKDKTVDFVHSIITLQHMKPQLQLVYIEQMCDALKPNGTGYFGIPITSMTNDENSHCNLKQEEQKMMMHYTEEKEIVRHLGNRGCSVVGTHERSDIGDAGVSKGFIFRKD